MATCPYVVRVNYYDEICGHDETSRHKHNYHGIYAYSFSDAAKQMENYYGDTIESLEIWCVDDEESIFYLPEDLARTYIEKGTYLD